MVYACRLPVRNLILPGFEGILAYSSIRMIESEIAEQLLGDRLGMMFSGAGRQVNLEADEPGRLIVYFIGIRETSEWLYAPIGTTDKQLPGGWYTTLAADGWTCCGWGNGSFKLYLSQELYDELLKFSYKPPYDRRLVPMMARHLWERPSR